MLNSLDPDQARHFVGPDLDPNCLEGLSAEDTNGQGVKALTEIGEPYGTEFCKTF